jgi:tetratricopeptide (TPR) repeat protein
MKIINKTTASVLGLIFMGSSVFAQSLADAKKAIDAEQYQKAKSMLKNLVITQATKDENYFYLGLVYIKQDYIDSARSVFNKGIEVNPKSALNFVGLGTADRADKNDASAKANFDKALALAGKDDKPYIYVAKAEISVKPYMSKEAIAVIESAKIKAAQTAAKDPELFTALGDAYRSESDNNNAYLSYNSASDLDPNSPVIIVNIGVLWKQANNFDDAIKQFQDALTKDPNFGPAYREMAETDLLIAKNDPKQTVAKRKEGADFYKKYLDLTDRSLESRMRYEDFLIQAGDFKTLETEANDLSKVANTNLRVYRYMGYSAYENGNYPAAETALTKFIKEADPKRIIAADYIYLGRTQLKLSGRDSLGIIALNKAIDMDSTMTDLHLDIANALYAKSKFAEAGDEYHKYIATARKVKLTDHYTEGKAYYFGFEDQSSAASKNPKIKPDSGLLVKADSAFSYVIQKTAANPFAPAVLYRAYIADEKEPADRTKGYFGYAKPYYEKYVELISPKTPYSDSDKKNLTSAYVYLGFYYELVAKDEAKAADAWGKAKDLDPTNKQVVAYYARKAAPAKSK